MNPFDEILDGIRLQHALYACFQLRAPWGVSFDTGEHARLLIVSKGGGYLKGEQRADPVLLEADTCMLVQPGVQFSLCDGKESPLVSCETLARYPRAEPIIHGGDGALTEIVTARFCFQQVGCRTPVQCAWPLGTHSLEGGRCCRHKKHPACAANRSAKSGLWNSAD